MSYKDFFEMVSHKPEEAIKMLLERPALALEADEHGTTALMDAVSSMRLNLNLVEALIDAGADVNARTTEGYTALICAVGAEAGSESRVSSSEAVKMLVKAGADLTARQHNGWNALGRALLEGQAEEVEALLEAGAKPDDEFTITRIPDVISGTPYLCQAVPEWKKVAALLKAGADPSVKNTDGEAALDCAKRWLAYLKAHPEGPFSKAEVEECIRLLEAHRGHAIPPPAR